MSFGKDIGGGALFTLGLVLVFGGIAMSFTGIGALCGIPAAIVGFPILLWGFLLQRKATTERQNVALQRSSDEVARIHAASLNMRICDVCRTPNPNDSTFCSSCGKTVLSR